MCTSPYRFTRVTARDDPNDPSTEYVVDGQYDVYVRETGEHLGTVVRRDEVTPGYHGRWVVSTGDHAPDGRPIRLAGETREQIARSLHRRRGNG